MAEVLSHWPPTRKIPPAQFSYPWDQWMELDENGHGDIWLVTLGIDWSADSNVANFRSTLYTRAQKVDKKRKANAKTVMRKVEDPETGKSHVRPVSTYVPFKVLIRAISTTQIAFQFYEGTTPPPEPEAPSRTVLPQRRPVRKPLHRRRPGLVTEKV